MSKNIMQMCADEIAGYLKRIADLEAKLAESEEDKKALICDYESRITKEQELMSWLEHNNEELKQQLAEKGQDKTDFAIEQLEKVRYDFFDISNGWWLCFRDGTQYMTHEELEGCVREVIDKQIKELKGEENV